MVNGDAAITQPLPGNGVADSRSQQVIRLGDDVVRRKQAVLREHQLLVRGQRVLM